MVCKLGHNSRFWLLGDFLCSDLVTANPINLALQEKCGMEYIKLSWASLDILLQGSLWLLISKCVYRVPGHKTWLETRLACF